METLLPFSPSPSLAYVSGSLNYGFGLLGGVFYTVEDIGIDCPGMLVPDLALFPTLMAGSYVSFDHDGGPIGVRFRDSYYGDNSGAGVTWKLQCYHPPEPPDPDDPNNGNDPLPSVSLSVTQPHTQATEGADDYIELKFSRPAMAGNGDITHFRNKMILTLFGDCRARNGDGTRNGGAARIRINCDCIKHIDNSVASPVRDESASPFRRQAGRSDLQTHPISSWATIPDQHYPCTTPTRRRRLRTKIVQIARQKPP